MAIGIAVVNAVVSFFDRLQKTKSAIYLSAKFFSQQIFSRQIFSRQIFSRQIFSRQIFFPPIFLTFQHQFFLISAKQQNLCQFFKTFYNGRARF